MLDAFLSPTAIAIITSLGAPAGLFVAEATGTFAQSLVVSETTKALTGFFRKRFAWEKLRNIYVEAVQETLDDKTLTLDKQVREDLFITTHSFKDFARFIEKYNNLCDLPFNKRKREASGAFREYVQQKVPNIPTNALDKLETNFSQGAFRVIDSCIKKSPEAFYREARDSLNRIEVDIERNATVSEDIRKDLEALQESALVFRKFAPEIPELKRDLSEITWKIDWTQRTLANLQREIATLNKNLSAPLGKSREHSDLISELAEMEEMYDGISENKVELRLKQRKKIEDLIERIRAFENDVLLLAKKISVTPINNKWFRETQEAFDDGDFKRATKNLEYSNLIRELADLEETYQALPENNIPERLKYSKKIEDQKKLVQTFKQNVYRLAETFKNIPMDI